MPVTVAPRRYRPLEANQADGRQAVGLARHWFSHPLVQFFTAGAVAMVVLVVGSGWLSERAATQEAIIDARATTELLGRSVVQPTLTRGVLQGNAAAIDRFDRQMLKRAMVGDVLRIKMWTRDGTIVYSDQTRLIGDRFALAGEELDVLLDGDSDAELLTSPNPRTASSGGLGGSSRCTRRCERRVGSDCSSRPTSRTTTCPVEALRCSTRSGRSPLPDCWSSSRSLGHLSGCSPAGWTRLPRPVSDSWSLPWRHQTSRGVGSLATCTTASSNSLPVRRSRCRPPRETLANDRSARGSWRTSPAGFGTACGLCDRCSWRSIRPSCRRRVSRLPLTTWWRRRRRRASEWMCTWSTPATFPTRPSRCCGGWRRRRSAMRNAMPTRPGWR